MKTSSLISLLSAIAPALAAPSGPARRDNPDVVEGKYIVQLKPGTSPEVVALHHGTVHNLIRRRDGSAGGSGGLEKTFRIGDFYAYSGSFDGTAAAAISGLDEVLVVEPNQIIRMDETEVGTPPASATPLAGRAPTTTQSNSTWGLGDLSHREAGADEYVYDETAGEGTVAYVLDSGIQKTHEEFEGRASFGFNAITGSTTPPWSNISDKSGHGTHVAATIAGKTYGVAKKAKIIDVKVMSFTQTTTDVVLEAITWAVDDVKSKGAQKKSVFNMSFGGYNDSALDNAVLAAYKEGILSVVAAGNSAGPATNISPARVPQALTVGATYVNRTRLAISSYGPVLDVFAPGHDIVSASHLSDTGSETMTGTSMAVPHVAGLVCYLRGLEGGLGTPKEVTDRIIELATPDVVKDTRGSPNLLVNNGSGR